MSLLPWLAYGAALLAGLVYAILASFERVYERITLPQLCYLAYVLLCSLVATRTGSLAAGLPFLAVPLGIFAWLTLRSEPEQSVSLQARAQQDLDLFRKVLAEKPGDVIALEGIADLYAKVGEPEPAKRWYAKLEQVYAANPAYERLRISLEEKVSNLELNPGAGTDPLLPFYLRACPKCDSMAFRSQFACQVCKEPFYAGKWRWRAAVVNRFLERHSLVPVTAASLLFLPFLHWFGNTAYFILLGVWSLGLRTHSGQKRVVQGELPGELPRFLLRTGMVACALAGIMSLSHGSRTARAFQRRGTAPQASPASTQPGNPGSIRPSMRPEVKVALTGALDRGEFDASYPPGTAMRAVIEEIAVHNASQTLEKAVAEARASGTLDAPYPSGLTLRQALFELSQGRSSPAVEKAAAEAAASGDLDKPFAGGLTFRQVLAEASQGYPGPAIEKALTLSRQADEAAARSEAAQAEALGTSPPSDDPKAVVSAVLPLLSRPERDAQLEAVQTLSDIRFAANAEEALPLLEPLTRSQDQDVADFAKLALERIRYCQGSTLCQAKWRKR
ncbi:MAG: hypothetical protein HY924_17030 [Elusimicrobia bacterium]|nr:hypothetical protein [Elusimicrobiota bacterium]